MGVAITVVYAVVVSAFAAPDWAVVIGNIVGITLLGAAFIAVGIFCSSLTENQVVSAVISFITLIAMYMLSTIGELIPSDLISSMMPDLGAVWRTIIVEAVVITITAICFFLFGKKAGVIIIGFIAMLVLGLFAAKGDLVPVIFNKLSFWERYTGFTYGLFDLSNALYFISATVVFLFLTVRVLEKRRWA